MAEFRYDPYVNRHVAGIVGSLRDMGAQQAQATQASGDAWGQAIGNIGQAIGSIPGQLAQAERAKAQAAEDQMRAQLLKGQVGEQTRATTARDTFAKIIKETPQMDEDGVSLYDIPAVGKQLAALGQDPGAAVEHLSKINDAFRQEKAAKMALVKTGAASIIAAGNDPTLAGHFLDQLKKNGTLTSDQAEKYHAFIAADPANVAKLTAMLAGPQKMERGAAGSVGINPITGMPVPGSEVADKPVAPTRASLAVDLSSPDPAVVARAKTALEAMKTETAPKGLQTEKFRLNGRDVMGTFNPTTGAYAYQGQDVTGKATPIPAASIQINNERKASGDLPPAKQRVVDSRVRVFDQLPVVKRTQVMAEAVGFANAIDIHTTNPQDDQALIYAYAKAMDPDSVVREGEYATVKEYSQTWAQNLGFKAERIFSNTAFLTPEARANMKKTIQTKFGATEKQYNAVRTSFGNQINRETGLQDGSERLTDYAAAFPTSGETKTPATPGEPLKIGGFTVTVKK